MQPVSLILDTDLGPDYDDVGAMAALLENYMMHQPGSK